METPEILKRVMDKKMLQSVMLDDIIAELIRRGIQVVYGNGLGLRGRVAFIPASMENFRESQEKRKRWEETRARDTGLSATPTEDVGNADNGQVDPDPHPEGNDSSGVGERSGHPDPAVGRAAPRM